MQRMLLRVFTARDSLLEVGVCVEGGMVSKQRRAAGSGIAPSISHLSSSRVTLSMILSTPVSDASQGLRVSQIQALIGPVGQFS